MIFKPEEVKTFAKTSEKLLEEFKKKMPSSSYEEHNPLEDFLFEFEGKHYGLYEVDTSDWDDEGKYQYQEIMYQLVSFDQKKYSYPYDKNIIEKYDTAVSISVQRCGSYFTEYYYSYSNVLVHKISIKHIPVQVIPAHEEVVLLNI